MDAQTKPKSSVKQKCQVCSEQAFYRCSGCRLLFYCGKQHQRDHWIHHKNKCKPYKITDEGVALATRDLAPGDFIVQESPIIWGPSSAENPICLGCGKSIGEDNNRPCLKCGWPLCGELCEKSPAHIPECRYTNQRGQRVQMKTSGIPDPVYKCVMLLRCLYHKQFLPKTWRRLEKLRTYPDLSNRPQEETLAEFVLRFFKLSLVFTVEDVVKVCGMVEINAVEVAPYVAIFGVVSSLRHSCRSNCTRSFNSSGGVVVTAGDKINEGEILTVSCVNPLWGTTDRRYHLHGKKFFWCCCSRCEDPSELGTNFSALKCQMEGCDGCLLPPSFTDLQKLPDWVCNKCSSAMSSYSVHDVLERAENDLKHLDKSSVEDCKRFLTMYQKLLSENHFHLTEVRKCLCEVLGDEDLQLKVQVCASLEAVIRRVAPAERHVFVEVLFQKVLAILKIKKRAEVENPVFEKELRNTLMEIIDLLRHAPEGSPEREILGKALEKMEEVEEMFGNNIQT